MRHYTNSERDLALIVGASDGTDNIVNMGGGTANSTSATLLKFYTSINDNT